MTTPVLPAAPPAPAAKGSGPPGAAEPKDSGFDRVLHQHEEARTATAEGHKKDKTDGDAADGHGDPRPDETQAPAEPDAAAIAAAVVPPVVVDAPADPAVVVAPSVVPPVTDATATDADAVAEVVAPPVPAATAEATPAVAEPALGAVAAAAVDPNAAPVAVSGAVPQGLATADADGAAPIVPAVVAATEAAVPGSATPAAEAPAASDAPATALAAAPVDPSAPADPAAAPAAPAPAAAATTPGAGTGADGDAGAGAPAAPAAEAAPATPATTAPAQAPSFASRLHDARAVAPAPVRVPVGESVEGLRDLMQLAHSRGAAHARLVLHPAEFGGVEVRLRSSSEGLQASVRAEHPEALAAMERGANDLRRSLEARGITVASLEFGLAPQQQDGNGARQGLGGGFGPAGASGAPAGDEDDTLLAGVAGSAPTNLSATTAGAMLDVLA